MRGRTLPLPLHTRANWLRWPALLPIVGLVIATLVSYREVLLPGRVLSDFDIWLYFYPLRDYAAQAIHAGRFPLWNPDTFLGAPFFANPQTSLLYPGTLPFYVLPVGYAYSLSVILHVGLAALFMYAFLRRAWSLAPIAAFVGAAGFAFGGFISSQIGHVNQLSASAWLPAIALCADTAFRKRSLRWAVAGAVALAAQLLAGHAQESYMTVWVVGILLLWRGTLGADRPALVGRVLTAVWVGAVVIAIGFGLAAAQLVPTAELSATSIRGGGMSDAEAISFSLPPPSLVRSMLPGYWFNLPSEELGYIGAIGLGFAAIGLLAARWRPVVCAAILAVVGIFFAFGGANPLYVPLLHHVPGLGLFRVPSRWLFVYTFGAAGLAALGVDWAFGRLRAEGERAPLPSRARVVAVALVLAVLAIAAVPSVIAVHGRIALLWLLGLLAAGVFAGVALRKPTRWVGGALTVCVLVELFFAAMDLPQRYPAPSVLLESHRAVPAYLQQHVPSGRILSIAPTEYALEDEAALAARYPLPSQGSFYFTSDIKLDEVMSPNTPLRYGLSTVDGYDGGVLPLRQFLRMGSLMVPPDEIRADGVLRTRLIAVPDAPLWRLFDIRAVIASQSVDPDLDGVRYDVATARTLTDSQSVSLNMQSPRPVQDVSLLGSLELPPGGTGQGHMAVQHADRSTEDFTLRVGDGLYLSTGPGPTSAPQPTAGLSRGGRQDSVTSVQLASASPVTSIEWLWDGGGAWSLRAATLVGPDGTQDQLILQPGLKRTMFAVLKVYEPETPAPDGIDLVPTAKVASDDDAFDLLKAMTPDDLAQTVVLAPNQPPLPTLDTSSQSGPARFVRQPGPPEKVVYRRASGSGGGILLVDDAWFPGWRAEVDGRPVTVYRADLGYKAVAVGADAQTVVLTYAPRSVIVGALATAASVLLAVALFFAGQLRAALRRGKWQQQAG